jgi:hypothetical protein
MTLFLASPVAAQRFSSEQLTQRSIGRRAIEAANWGMPVVNYDRMFLAFKDAGGGFNEVVYWSGLSKWKNQVLTPNPDTIYVAPFFDTKDVWPVVIEIPAAGDEGSITGTIMDFWQAALEDVGPAGVEKGKDGKYLILPLQQGSPAGGLHRPALDDPRRLCAASLLKNGDDAGVKQAVDYVLKGVKLYQNTRIDDQGAPLTGAYKYVLRFARDQIPPVSVFWNLNMYDEKEFFIKNDFKRYSIGSTTDGLKTASDGPIKIYLQKDNPGPDKQSNWLPAPSGSFNLTMRLYGAQTPVLDGTYRPPGVRKQR